MCFKIVGGCARGKAIKINLQCQWIWSAVCREEWWIFPIQISDDVETVFTTNEKEKENAKSAIRLSRDNNVQIANFPIYDKYEFEMP